MRHGFPGLVSIPLAVVAGVLFVTSVHAAKPGGGAEDPCALATDFPAFAFDVASAKSRTIYLADSTGKCIRVLTSGRQPKFSYPVDGTSNKGRVVWRDSGSVIKAADFTVEPGNKLTGITVRTLVSNAGCCLHDLSKDGSTLYLSVSDSVLAKLDVAGTGGPTNLFASDTDWFYQMGSINGDGTLLFATKTGYGANGGASRLVKVNLGIVPAEETVLREWLPQAGFGANPFWPSADPHSDRIAFHEYVLNSNNCSPLTVTDYDGAETEDTKNLAVERYGRDPTWVGGRIVMQRRSPMNGSGSCSSTTSLVEVILGSGQETVLATGHYPDGR